MMMNLLASTSVALENILDDLGEATTSPYTIPLGPPEIQTLFYAIFLIAFPTLVIAIKTDNVTPPLVALMLGSFLVMPLAGQYGSYFLIAGGVFLGILFFKMYKGARR